MGIRLTGNWRRFRRLLNRPEFQRRLQHEVGRATALNAKYVAREIRQTIKSGALAPNAPSTIRLKRSSKPLIDTGDMFKSINGHKVNWATGFAGILRNARGRSGNLYNLALIHHNGATIRRGTGYIRIPARPFIQIAVDRTEVSRKIKENWEEAVERAFRSR